MTPKETKTLARRFVEAFNRGDLDEVRELLAEDATWFLYGTLPPSGLWQGRDAILDEFLPRGGRLFGPRSPQFEITSAVAEEGVALLELSATGTTARGDDYRNLYVLAFEATDGRVTAVREYMDTEAWRRLLRP